MKNELHKVGPNNLAVMELIPVKQTYLHPVVFVHGSFGGYMMWKMVARIFADKGFHVYALSLRGHRPNSEVDLGEVHMSDYVQDIKDVVEGLSIDNPTVIGHSMAGLLVMMYAKENPISRVVAIDPSPSIEVTKEPLSEEKIASIKPVYSAADAGMPMDQIEAMKVMPDISSIMLMKMKEMFGLESGTARIDRKRGISIPKDSIASPLIFIGAEFGDSLPFGISAKQTRAMAVYYQSPFVQIDGATHPGVIVGEYAEDMVKKVMSWLNN